MGWGIRVLIFSVAFITGILVANFVGPTVTATNESFGDVELSSASGSSLVVSCVDGVPNIAEVKGVEGAVQLKCDKSEMRVVRSTPSIPRLEPRFIVPSPPIAAAVSTGK